MEDFPITLIGDANHAAAQRDCVARLTGRRTIEQKLRGETRERLLELVQRCDPNGCWTDELGEAEGFDPATKDDLLAMLLDEDHEDMAAWIAERIA